MQELRLITAIDEGVRLLLRSPDGSEYTLALDEKLKAAIRGDRVRLGQLEIETDTPLRPRDIQARIRAGESATDVAVAAGIPLERVRRYEGPVLAEREHMAAMARRTALRGSVLNDGPARLLGDAVAERLRERGVDPETAGWDSWRREDSRWQVVVTYHRRLPDGPPEPGGAEGEPPLGASSESIERAQFVFDPARRTIGADDDSARLLIAEQRSVTADAMVALIPTMTGALADDQADPLDSGDWPEAAGSGRDGGGRRARQTAANRRGRRDPLDTGRIPQDVAADESDLKAGGDAPELDDHGGPAPVTYGTSALGSGAQPTPGHGSAAAFRGEDGRAIPRVGVPAMGGLVPLAPVPPRRPLQRDDSDGPRPRRPRRPHVPASATAPIRRQSVYEERLIKPTDRPAVGPRSRRASVPSWDEILFGTRTRTSD
jgi:hypothetical protein